MTENEREFVATYKGRLGEAMEIYRSHRAQPELAWKPFAKVRLFG
jgi:hypothetical protein